KSGVEHPRGRYPPKCLRPLPSTGHGRNARGLYGAALIDSMMIGSLKFSRVRTGLAAAFSSASALGLSSLEKPGAGSTESAPAPRAILVAKWRRVVFIRRV